MIGVFTAMKLKEIYRSGKYYSVCECDRARGLVIHVICGGVGMYSRIIELSEDEISEFRRDGNLDDLAFKVKKGDQEVLKREVLPQSEKEQIEYVQIL